MLSQLERPSPKESSQCFLYSHTEFDFQVLADVAVIRHIFLEPHLSVGFLTTI